MGTTLDVFADVFSGATPKTAVPIQWDGEGPVTTLGRDRRGCLGSGPLLDADVVASEQPLTLCLIRGSQSKVRAYGEEASVRREELVRRAGEALGVRMSAGSAHVEPVDDTRSARRFMISTLDSAGVTRSVVVDDESGDATVTPVRGHTQLTDLERRTAAQIAIRDPRSQAFLDGREAHALARLAVSAADLGRRAVVFLRPDDEHRAYVIVDLLAGAVMGWTDRSNGDR
ncbi:hypothetical protein [Microlunatus sp. Gsoil 973]|uniref:hypothetical protein n=1 Tax=Microlunatus sp. Gsoil 973 TaxID=2672569 RepID=UPI0018A7E969|nr:hypothetical protein [Microlunatus sp. Gsoil 973]